MPQLNNFFMRSPDDNEGGNIAENKDDDKKINSEQSEDIEAKKTKKPFFKKLRDALQDWSNEDQREQQFDDTRP